MNERGYMYNSSNNYDAHCSVNITNNPVPHGYCQCRCGRKTGIATRTRPSLGHIKGQPYKYILGHKKNPRKYPLFPGVHYCDCGCGKETPLAKHTNKERGIVCGMPCRYLKGHHGKHKPMSLEARINNSRAKTGKDPIFSPFIPDTIIRFDPNHKRWTTSDYKTRKRRMYHAKAVYEFYHGPIPSGMYVHHRDGKHSEINDDRPDNLMLLSYDWNLNHIPGFAREFGFSTKEVTDVYERLASGYRDVDLFVEVARELIRLYDSRTGKGGTRK